MKYFQLLKKIRTTKKITQKEIAKHLNVSVRNYQYIESGEQNLNQDQIILLADYFNVSADYLLGRTDNPKMNR